MTANEKHVQCNVHGLIELIPFARVVINSMIYKRLKGLKQLGNTHEVYPTANHTRFEHCIGVYHLAGVVCDRLKEIGMPVTEADKTCVQMAGLLHDAGHGPASHLWEPFSHGGAGAGWEHEDSSCEMIDLIIKDKKIDLAKFGLNSQDLVFIKEMITGKGTRDGGGYPYAGRPAEKFYLYEIISNKLTGIDVDKWDYLLRDSLATGVKITFTYERLVTFMKIFPWRSQEWGVDLQRIAIRDKEKDTIQEMFRDRSRLHRRTYQHDVVKVVDRMMLDSWSAADSAYPKIRGREGRMYSLSEACKDVVALSKLTDEVVNQTILHSEDPALASSRRLLERIANRDLYTIIATISGNLPEKDRTYEAELRNFGGEQLDFCISKRYIDMGKKRCNPVTKVLFYTKNGEQTMELGDEDLAEFAPSKIFHENLFVLLRTEDPDASTIERARQATSAWTSGRGWEVKL